jgi:hypothetical protein
MSIRLSVSEKELQQAADGLIRELLGDLRDAVSDETRGLEQDLEKITRLSVKGKLWRAWRSDMFPKSGGIAKEPRGRIIINGGKRSVGALTFFTREGRIAAGGGGYLAIPTDAAGPRGRRNDLTPGEWEKRTGKKLRFVYRKGRPSLLVLDDARVTGRKGVARGRLTKRQGPGYGATVVVFVLLPYVDFSPRFAVQPLIDRREGMLKSNIERRFGR